MYYFLFQVRPKPGTEHAAKCAGAYMSCWIDFKDQGGAEQLARFALDDEGWIIDTCDDVRCPTRDDYESPDPDVRECLQFFDEAQKHGWSFSFNAWGHDAPDKDV